MLAMNMCSSGKINRNHEGSWVNTDEDQILCVVLSSKTSLYFLVRTWG